MRWALAALGLGLEAAALAVYLFEPLHRRLNSRRRRVAVAAAWLAGALSLSLFALMDHDLTLLLGQGLACLVFFIMLRNGGGHV